jgi:hypothetical protein
MITKFYEFMDSGLKPYISPISSLFVYHKCDDCGVLYKRFNEVDKYCKYCNSINIKVISETEYFKTIKSYLSPEEYKKIIQKKKKDDESLVDLSKIHLLKNKNIN